MSQGDLQICDLNLRVVLSSDLWLEVSLNAKSTLVRPVILYHKKLKRKDDTVIFFNVHQF